MSFDAATTWARVRSAVTSSQYPRRLSYTIAVTGLDGQRPASDHYRASCDPSDGAIRLFSMSDEELAKPPPIPRGVNVGISIGICFGLCGGIYEPLGHPEPYWDLLGEPLLDPTYMFGLRYRSAMESASPSQGGSALRIIATVSAQKPDYQIALVDTPSVDGIPTYHLELTPLRKPKVNRLRELWVATNNYLPIRAIISGNFTVAPLVDVPWTVDFSTVGGAPYISREVADDTLYLQHRRIVKKAVIAFEDVREASGTIYDLPLVTPEATDSTLVEPRN